MKQETNKYEPKECAVGEKLSELFRKDVDQRRKEEGYKH